MLVAAAVVCLATPLGRAQETGDDGDAKAKGRLIDRGTFVEDTQTGLLWQKDGASSGKMNFYQAAEYARQLELGGLRGWRVPTHDELRTIFPAAEPPFTNSGYTKEMCCGGGIEFRSYWTCEIDPRLEDYAYVFHWYARGGKNNCYASRNFVLVRCVHGTTEMPTKAIDPKIDTARVRDLIAQLGDDDFAKRQQAMDELVKAAGAIGPILREAEQSAEEFEIRYRIQQILRRRGE
jgi:hypothetical protein